MKGVCLMLALMTTVCAQEYYDYSEPPTTCVDYNCPAGSKCRIIVALPSYNVRAECVRRRSIPKPHRACGKTGFPLLKDLEDGGKLKVFKTDGGCPDVWVWTGTYCCIDTGLSREGSCPKPCGINGCDPSIPQCDDKCESDGYCKKGKKCCPSKCGGKKCVKPEF